MKTAVHDHRRLYSIIVDHNNVTASAASHQSMEPKIIKEEAIERDTSVLDEPAINNNNNNKESAFRIHTRKSKIKSKDAGFSSTSTSDSSGEHLLSPTHPLPAQIDGESESSSPPSDTFRNHSNIKRFLTTLVQFSGQVSPQTSDRVKGQIFTLVNNLISVEEFHHNIQEMTNFPLRPFVLPFLKSHLPSLQRDLLAMARNNKQTLSQYLKQHENAYLDRDSQPSEPSEIFHQLERVPAPPPTAARENNVGGGHKRPYPLAAAAAAMTAMQAAADGYYDAGYAADLDYQQPCVKRPNLGYGGVPFMYHHHHPPPHAHPHPHPHLHPQEPPPMPPSSSSAAAAAAAAAASSSHPYNMLPLLHIRDADQDLHKGHVEDEWKNIHVMLNCILSMVEKTKKALGILQERGLTDANFPDWNRKRSTEEMLALTVRQTEERIESIKKKAEDSMTEIRHQATMELQKLVLAAENKMIELVTAERTRTSGTRSSGAGLQISPSLMSQYNSCWNCGRKAQETCSGCNTAQYCSSFCQHKDWDTHHQTCCVHSAAGATAIATTNAAAATAAITTIATATTTTIATTNTSGGIAANCSGGGAATNSTGHHSQQQPSSAVKKQQQPPSSSGSQADDLSVSRQPPQSTVAPSSTSSSSSSSSASAAVIAGDFDKQQLQQSSAAVTASTAVTTATVAPVTANGDGGGGKRQ